MVRFWKQFAGLGIVSRHSVFLRARLKLTALYVLIVAIIIFGFSIFIYQNIGHNLRDTSDDEFADVESHQAFADNTLNSVKDDLMLADIFILLVTAGLSFVLAGKTLKPIQLSVEAQKAFAANASHELRTPLAVMRNDIEVYLRNITPTKELTRMTMNSNLEEINHMSSITEDLLLLARADNKTITQHEDVDISIVVKNVIERMKSLALSKNIKLSYITSGPFTIKGTYSSLERVILNILQNSLDHTPSGGSIVVKVEKEQSKALLSITDTGSGIDPKDLSNIFTRFYKGNSAKGTGLGLSIVKEIIDQHNGDISVESTLGKGTTVSIRFSLA